MTRHPRHHILALVLLAVAVAALEAADDPSKPSSRPTQALTDAIDKAILARLTTEKIPPSAICDDAEFLRRVFVDLTGRVPTSRRAAEFLDSTDAKKREKLVAELLASKHYGTHFGSLWRDLLVRPDANMIRPPDTTPLVGWMAEQFNKNTGWNSIVKDMLVVEGPKPEGLFHVLNGDSRGNPQANVTAGVVGQLFMGTQLACAECHNHPFVPTWKQTDFWGIAAFFGKVSAAGKAKGNFAGNDITETSKVGGKRNQSPKTVGASIVIPNTSFKLIGKRINARFPHGEEPKLDSTKPFRPAFAEWLTAKDNEFFAPNAVNRLWAHLFGKGFVNPVGEMSELNPASHPELLAALAAAFAESAFDQKFLLTAICNSKTYQRSSRPLAGNKLDDHFFARMEVKVLGPRVLYDSLTIALAVESLSPVAPKGAAKKGKKANNRFPPIDARQQFINFYSTREAEGDVTDYTHGIPQALRLMNQDLFNTGGKTIEALVRAGGGPNKVVEGLYLAAVSRRPTPEENRESLAYVKKQKDSTTGYRGVLWALLNSAEFMLNR